MSKSSSSVSKLLRAERFKFTPTRFAEVTEKVSLSRLEQFPNLCIRHRYRRFKKCVDNSSEHLFGRGKYRGGRHHAHAAYLLIQDSQRGDFGLCVLKRIREAFRSYLNEFLIEILPTEPVLDDPLRANQPLLNNPGAQERHRSADRGSAEGAAAEIKVASISSPIRQAGSTPEKKTLQDCIRSAYPS